MPLRSVLDRGQILTEQVFRAILVRGGSNGLAVDNLQIVFGYLIRFPYWHKAGWDSLDFGQPFGDGVPTQSFPHNGRFSTRQIQNGGYPIGRLRAVIDDRVY